MNTNIYFWSHFSLLFLEWKIFQAKVVEEIKTHILCSMTCFGTSYHLSDKVEKYCRDEQAIDDNKTQAHCMLNT